MPKTSCESLIKSIKKLCKGQHTITATSDCYGTYLYLPEIKLVIDCVKPSNTEQSATTNIRRYADITHLIFYPDGSDSYSRRALRAVSKHITSGVDQLDAKAQSVIDFVSLLHKILWYEGSCSFEPIEGYSVELYTPDYQLVVDCKYHTYSTEYAESITSHVQDTLNCTYMVFNLDAPGFDINAAVNRFKTYIKGHLHTS